MNNPIKNGLMLLFLLILVANMISGFQYSNGLALTSVSNTEAKGSVDTSEVRSQESSETPSEKGSDASNKSGTETNQS